MIRANRIAKVLFSSCAIVLLHQNIAAQTAHLESVSFSNVHITDAFWKPRIDAIANVTIPVCMEQTEIKTPRIRNFEKVARRQGETHEGIYFDDSDVYKALQAIAYSLRNHPDATLETRADSWIDKIAAAQLPDGYLNTYYTLSGLNKRWTDMEKHEDYCAGHLIEAAVAYYQTTGKRKLLDVAIRFANHIDSTFRLQNKHWVSGHQEIELALVKLYHLTHNDRYLKLAQWYLEQRGHGYGQGVIWNDWKDPAYCQDDKPVKEQNQIEGHAVRAMYLYTGAADVAATTGDTGYMKAMKTIWEDVVYRNMYFTGGIGSSGRNEGFTTDYDLPNDDAYCETCASVGMVFWNQRMNLLTGDSKYADVLERSLYNGALDGLSLKGDRFFYGNPLYSAGGYGRREWFGTACCPSNIARLVASLGDYIYAKNSNTIVVNLFVGSTAAIALGKQTIMLQQQTTYPWNGRVQFTVSPEKKASFALRLRIPGWAHNEPVPGNTYRYLKNDAQPVSLIVNGKKFAYTQDQGYAVINREWKKGDVIVFQMPMPVQRVIATDSVKNDRNQVALQRGPLVYCFEGADNNGQALNLLLPDEATFSITHTDTLLNGVTVLRAELPAVTVSSDGLQVQTTRQVATAIPYYAWANRGAGQMQVWLPRRAGAVKVSAQ